MRLIFPFIIFCLLSVAANAQSQPIPHLEKDGRVTKLIVQGKPFLVLGGELHNSSTSGAAYMRPIWKRMSEKNLNTVIAAVYWELVEPQEGKFDFALVDSMISGARREKLHLVILWFGSWKNGYSVYAPGWVKNNSGKYPRAKDNSGKTLQHLSTFGEATALKDAAAFKALMQHVRATDEKYQTVIAAQIENEVGLFGIPRDYRPEAEQAYQSQVPKDLINYLVSHKSSLQPAIDSAWRMNGYKTTGNWEDVFGKSIFDQKDWKAFSFLTEELFTVYHYAKYIGGVAAAGKLAYPIPMYVNAWIKQDGFAWPGRYPAGGPIPHTLDMWHAAAPAVDFIAPDIYVPDAKYILGQYHLPGNPVFIPEIRPGIQSANEAFWAFGEHEAICFSPFGIDDTEAKDDPITQTYAVLKQAGDLIMQQYGKGTMRGIYLDSISSKQVFELGGYQVTASLGTGSMAELAGFSIGQKKTQMAGGIIIHTTPDEFIVIGKDYNLGFKSLKEDDQTLDVEYLDEGSFVNGKWVTSRRLNGDEGTGGGDYGFGFGNPKVASLRFRPKASGEYSIVRFKIYKYH
ncbi:MAG: DUF5597 domain-containing protein [Bacteroidota bacterium]